MKKQLFLSALAFFFGCFLVNAQDQMMDRASLDQRVSYMMRHTAPLNLDARVSAKVQVIMTDYLRATQNTSSERMAVYSISSEGSRVAVADGGRVAVNNESRMASTESERMSSTQTDARLASTESERMSNQNDARVSSNESARASSNYDSRVAAPNTANRKLLAAERDAQMRMVLTEDQFRIWSMEIAPSLYY